MSIAIMKINKKKPWHWVSLFLLGLGCMLSILIRPFRSKRNVGIVLYGHQLSGNLLRLYQVMEADEVKNFEYVYFSMDDAYVRRLREQGFRAVSVFEAKSIRCLAEAHCIVSDHGLHFLELLLYVTNIKFIDVWHGIPFKGFDSVDFRVQRKYDEVWVSSEYMKEMYTNKYLFEPEKVRVTGYGRVDIFKNILTMNKH